MTKKIILTVLTLCFLTSVASAAKMPPSIERATAEPVKYVGTRQTDKGFFAQANIGELFHHASQRKKDLPRAGVPVKEAVYYLDNVSIIP